ncbi:hypothetical protein QBC47DRAFT_298270 [Echria macrotheca]|uniref:FAD-binding domain-containing protein n=1 Tax=Echria macrotheca TaxID=438768 RepID=A0AAJ0BER1_9PEZI|nr:hypothetical protein QBC47DRAFT_298270 [Echria macrotheca]
MSQNDCDVLIVGAGPVGMALALELALQNVSFRIIDQAPVRSTKSRALVVQSRTLELLNRHGDVKPLMARGQIVRGANSFVERRLVAHVRLDTIPSFTTTRFLLPLGVSQADTEQFLDECLARYGRSVERPVTAKDISQDKDGVSTKLEKQDGSEEMVRSKYVVGCDGAHSAVRHAATNLTFEGAAYPVDFILCDARLNDSNVPTDTFALCLGNGALALFPLGNGVLRVVVAGNNILSEEEPKLEDFQAFFTAFTPPGSGTLSDPIWLTRFRLHHRGVNNYRDGRLFVAGDAAHIHSPAGGQGMNTGIQDSINLGWKLAAALQGRTANPEALLNSYHAERHRIGEHLLNTTDKMFSFAVNMNWIFRVIRNLILPWVIPWFARSDYRRQRFLKFASEFGVTYRKSPVVGAAEGFAGPVGKGDRLPEGTLKDVKSQEEAHLQEICGGMTHCLLLFSGTIAGDLATAADLQAAYKSMDAASKDELAVAYIHADVNLPKDSPDGSYVDPEGTVHAQFGFTWPSYILVRPDSYVAHIGPLSQVDGLLDFLKICGLISSPITIKVQHLPRFFYSTMFAENPSLIQEAPLSASWLKPTPLVMIHDGGGTTFSYYLLGNLDRTVYGIANPHFRSGEAWEGGIPEMARYYVDLIKSVIPRGKVILGGWSLGGLISLQVARILAEDPTVQVLGIIMIDSVCPKLVPTNIVRVAQHAIEWSPTTRQETRDSIMRCFAEASRMVGEWTLPDWEDKAAQSSEPGAFDRNVDTAWAAQVSQPPLIKPSPPPVILLRATEPVPVIEEGVSRVDIHRSDRHLGWDQYRKDLIKEVIDLPGVHHFNIFVGENSLDTTTAQIKKAIRSIEIRAPARAF